MNFRERIYKVIEHQIPDRVPVIPFVMQYAAKISGIKYRDYCTDAKAMAKAQLRCIEEFGYDAVNVSSDAHRLADALGGELNFPVNGVPTVKVPPIRTPQDLQEAKVPDPYQEPRCKQRLKAIQIIRQKAPGIPIIGWIEGALSEASSIYGVKKTLMSFHTNKGFLKELFEFAMEFDLKFGKAQIEAGADIIGAGDSLASQISASHFRKTIQYTGSIFEKLSVPTLYHVCGDTTHQLVNLKNSRADIVDLDWQVELKEAREVFGREVCIRGNVNPTLFVSGTPSQIKQHCLESIKDAGRKGNFILSAGCEIPPNSKQKNLLAMSQAGFGYYYNS